MYSGDDPTHGIVFDGWRWSISVDNVAPRLMASMRVRIGWKFKGSGG